MNYINTILLSAVFTVFTSVNFAQQYSSKSKKAIKAYESALNYYDSKNNEGALLELEKALSIDNNFIEAHSLIAYVYTDMRQYENAITHLKKSIEIDPKFFPNNYFSLAVVEKETGKYNDAAEHFKAFLNSGAAKGDLKYRADFGIKCSEFASKGMKTPVPFNPENLGNSVNSADHEYYPAITADGKTLLLTRKIKDKRNPFGEQEDFFISKSENGKWQPAYNMGPPINTSYNEGSPTLSPDGQFLIFAACVELDGYGPDRKGFGSCDIFITRKKGNNWDMPKNIGQPVNSNAWDVQPSYSSDGKTLYFISNRKGSIGDADIWMSSLSDDGKWMLPVNLGPKINTPGREESVFIHPDNQTLYFTSNGHIGYGGTDIYVSRKEKTGEWGEPVNLGYPINTWNDENSFFVDASGSTAYFASDRKGGFGGLDLYSFELYEKARPVPVTYAKGFVYNAKTKEKLAANFELIDIDNKEVVARSVSDEINGQFLVCLPINKNYALNVSKEGFLFYSENFSIKDKLNSSEPYLMDVPLQPIEKGGKVVLKNIFFETAKYDLKNESEAELKKLIAFLNTNPKIKIEIGGHTDNVGNKQSNQQLSENRAKSVYNYLTNNGIKPERLSFAGYGDAQPVASNENEEGRARNRRTEFKVMEN